MKTAKDEGVDTVIDVTTFDGGGRDVRFGEEVSRKSGMQIVACTGQHIFAPKSLNERAVEQLIDAGFGDKIFLSNDWVLGDTVREELNPDGMLFNTRKTIPYLKEIGVSRRAIRAITVDNPARFFARS